MIVSKRGIQPRHIVFLLLFIGLLITIRWYWHNQTAASDPPAIERGVLDLRGVDLEADGPFRLDGEWSLYPDQWIGASTEAGASALPVPVHVPGGWNGAFVDAGGEHGYGTYRLRILLDKPVQEPISFWFQAVNTAAEVEINGKLLSRLEARPDTLRMPASRPGAFKVTYDPEQRTELDLYVRVSNDQSPHSGGIIRSVQFGDSAAVNRGYIYSIGFQLILCVIVLLHALYALLIYLMKSPRSELVSYALMMITGSLTIASFHSGLLFIWFDIDYVWGMRIMALAYIGFGYFLLDMGRRIVGERRRGRLYYLYLLLLCGYTLFLLFGPEAQAVSTIENSSFMALYYIPLFWTAYYFLKMVMIRAEGALLLLVAVCAVINNILWGTVYYSTASQFIFYPVDLLAAIVSFSAYWFNKYIQNANRVVQLNEQLESANRQKDRFLANTSHELRTPLHGILNLAQSLLARKRTALDEQSQRDMELMIQISRRMSLMLNDLLDIVRLQEKRIAANVAAVDFGSVAGGVVDMLRFVADGRPVELRLAVAENLPRVRADEERLIQILINLIHNALKFTKEGTVEVGARTEGGGIRVYVRDTGDGMDEATQRRVFLPYEQGRPERGGIGLGLSICKELVELHGSTLTVRSSPGQGSEFSFTLSEAGGLASATRHAAEPALEALAEAAATAETGTGDYAPASARDAYAFKTQELGLELDETLPLGREPIHVLAVDDDPVNLKVLAHILPAGQYRLEAAYSGEQALVKLEQRQWDLVIADVMMPGMSGYELTRRIRERFTLYELPVILLTARSEPADTYAGFAAGANDYVSKPVDALELRYRARSLSSQKQAVGERLRMEAAYLQAQIHPHFLFNTLNSIQALSDLDNERMRELVDAFSTYLRISFDFLIAGVGVPVERELQLVENYLFIEKQRFADRLTVQWDVAAVPALDIPPLTLQPIVENAVRHGLMKQPEGGTLRISIREKEGGWRFAVFDSGVGMSAEQVRRLFEPAGRIGRGIGLLNTHMRLKRLYGQGLVVWSEPGTGTEVSFDVPQAGQRA